MLLDEGLQFSSHGALHAAFGNQFARTSRVDPKLHRYLLDAFRQRQLADYSAAPMISEEDNRELLSRAQEFIAVAEQFLKAIG